MGRVLREQARAPLAQALSLRLLLSRLALMPLQSLRTSPTPSFLVVPSVLCSVCVCCKLLIEVEAAGMSR